MTELGIYCIYPKSFCIPRLYIVTIILNNTTIVVELKYWQIIDSNMDTEFIKYKFHIF